MYDSNNLAHKYKWKRKFFTIYKQGVLLSDNESIPNIPYLTYLDLNKFSLHITLFRTGENPNSSYIINFTNKFSWIFDCHDITKTGIYKNINQKVSNTNYSDLIKKNKFKISITCDLLKKTALIFVNQKLYEKAYLDTKTLSPAISLVNQDHDTQENNILLQKIKIYDGNKKLLFSVKYPPYAFLFRQLFLLSFIIGIALFFILAILQKKTLGKIFYHLLCLCLLEIFLRTTFTDENAKFHLYLIIKNLEWNIENTTNLLGNYNEKIHFTNKAGTIYPVVKPSSTKRIICLGSSSTAGAGLVDRKKAYPTLLEKKINFQKKEKHYEVINAGLGGHETFRISIYFKDILVRLKPDIVTIYLGRNDESMEKSKNLLTTYQKMQKIMQIHSDWITNQRLLLLSLDFRYPFKKIVHLYDFLHSSYIFTGLTNLRRKMFNQIYYLSNIKPLTSKTNEGIGEDSLYDIVNRCLQRNIKVLLIPELFNQKGDLTLEYSNYHKIMKRISQKYQDVYYLNLIKAFNNVPDKFLLFYDVVHPTEYGHKIIAEEIYRKLKEKKLI
ncbi:SGNH/GDSL hydrolase family protein [Candidatus Auribacterota bacterium]